MKKLLPFVFAVLIVFSACGQASEAAETEASLSDTVIISETSSDTLSETVPEAFEADVPGYVRFSEMTPEEIVSELTLEEKAAQMVQPAVYNISPEDMGRYCYGSILSNIGSPSFEVWQEVIGSFQESACASDAGIPFIYGQDDVHGVNYCAGAVIFPHNIGIGAANDPELTYEMGLAAADEARLCHMLWNFAPCVAQSEDPRWGRTYESYGSDLSVITSLSTAFTRGLVDGGVIACPKHFFGDGNVEYGTGECSDVDRLIDRGNAVLSDNEINELLEVYRAQIDAGAQTIMISHSAVNGVKMHENGRYIMQLKNDMGFEGFVVSDWNSVQNTSPSDYRDQVILSVNSGIDMLMEVDRFNEAMDIIISAGESGEIPMERIDDAVLRIIRVKKNAGVFDDPFFERLETVQSSTGSEEYRRLAEELVQKSLVLIKNKNDILPLKEGMSVYITGPAADNAQAQCGGWTVDWNRSPKTQITGVTTILQGFKDRADQYGLNIITDPQKAEEADAVILVVGEKAYAEWNGDTEDLELCGDMGLGGNLSAIEEARSLGKPVIACIVAGRNVIISDFIDEWDGVVMCYLPGSEGQGVADMLCGEEKFSGRLPCPWYEDISQIGSEDRLFEAGFGLE
ncbi:MAG: glycoside hydrolase family 3 protein [Oscillospiraceae bacterium]|nr:glycoside hydrolase family 3 protein [Oscillospiraceae bacterium]